MRRVLRRLHEDEGGQVLVPAALLTVGLLAIAGLLVDGGLVLAQRRELQGVADAAALAGAMQLDERVYRASGGSEVLLDEDAAADSAVAYLAAEAGLEYAVGATETGVEVVAVRQAETAFLRLLGVEAVEISAHASSEPRYGTSGGGP